MVYATKRIFNVTTGETQLIDLTGEEIAARDAESAAALLEWQNQQAIDNNTQLAINYLRNADYSGMIEAVNASTLPVNQKQLFINILRGQMAIVQILRTIGRNLDATA